MTHIAAGVCLHRRLVYLVVITSHVAACTFTVGVVMVLMTIDASRDGFNRIERDGTNMTVDTDIAVVRRVLEISIPGARGITCRRHFE